MATKKKMPPLCGNWPPSRGPLPPWLKEPKLKVIAPERTDGPPPRRLTAEEQRKRLASPLLVQLSSSSSSFGHSELEKAVKRATPKAPKKKCGNPGKWRMCIHVASLAELTARQACNVVYAHAVCPPRPVGVGDPSQLTPREQQERQKENAKWRRQVPEFPYDEAVCTTINYPLRRELHLVVPPYQLSRGKRSWSWMDLGYFLWVVAREYQRVYRQHRKYGVWGHAITDLWFEGLVLSREKGAWVARLLIGS